MHVALLEHMGYFGNALDHRSTFHLQDYLQNDFPIRSRTICFSLVFVVMGVLAGILVFFSILFMRRISSNSCGLIENVTEEVGSWVCPLMTSSRQLSSVV